MTKANTDAAADMSKAYAKAGGVASETISSLRTVASLSAEDVQAEHYARNLSAASKAHVRKSWRVGFANGLLFSSGNIMAGVGFIYGNYKIAQMLLKENTIGAGGHVIYCANQTAVKAGEGS